MVQLLALYSSLGRIYTVNTDKNQLPYTKYTKIYYKGIIVDWKIKIAIYIKIVEKHCSPK